MFCNNYTANGSSLRAIVNTSKYGAAEITEKFNLIFNNITMIKITNL